MADYTEAVVGGVDDPMLEDNVKEEGRWKMIGILVVVDMADCLGENGLVWER